MFPQTYWPASFYGKDFWPGEQALVPAPTPTVEPDRQPSGSGGVLGKMPKTSRNFYPDLRGDPRRQRAIEKAEREEEEEALALVVALATAEW